MQYQVTVTDTVIYRGTVHADSNGHAVEIAENDLHRFGGIFPGVIAFERVTHRTITVEQITPVIPVIVPAEPAEAAEPAEPATVEPQGDRLPFIGTPTELRVDAEPVEPARSWHLGRAHGGTFPEEDNCPCVKAVCGLVETANPACREHAPDRTFRQIHLAENCPALAEQAPTA